MNLHDIAGPAIGTVNPFVQAQYFASSGSTPNADFTRSASYAAAVPMRVQQQAVNQRTLERLQGLNLQGQFCSLWLDGTAFGVVRPTGKGGDYFVIGAQGWLIVEVPEMWPQSGWVHVTVQLQTWTTPP